MGAHPFRLDKIFVATLMARPFASALRVRVS